MKKKFDINFTGIACKEARQWYATQPDFTTAWNNCHRGDWMLWITSKLEVDIKTLTLAKAHCAATVRNLMRDCRSKEALLVSFRFAKGNATLEELETAATAASDAAIYAATNYTNATNYVATYAASAYAAYAAYASSAAAYAASASAHDASSAARDASTATRDASTATYTKGNIKNQLLTANICRKILTKEVMELIDKY